jgi:hypothetical protein
MADDVSRAKPIAIRLLARLLDATLDDEAANVLVRAADEAARRLDSCLERRRTQHDNRLRSVAAVLQ